MELLRKEPRVYLARSRFKQANMPSEALWGGVRAWDGLVMHADSCTVATYYGPVSSKPDYVSMCLGRQAAAELMGKRADRPVSSRMRLCQSVFI